jgi:hypothetical protein
MCYFPCFVEIEKVEAKTDNVKLFTIPENDEEFEGELEKELNTIVQDEREKMISTIRRRLKPKASSSSVEQGSNQS